VRDLAGSLLLVFDIGNSLECRWRACCSPHFAALLVMVIVWLLQRGMGTRARALLEETKAESRFEQERIKRGKSFSRLQEAAS